MLKEKTEIWKKMPRNTPEELAAADTFFDDELMPLSLQVFSEKHEKLNLPQYYGMVLTLGTSWQPLALSIATLKPQKALLLCTESTLPLISNLEKFLNKNGKDEIQIEYAIVSRSDVDSIYTQMAEHYKLWQAKGKNCVDITGGTKAMASGAAMMAAVLGLDIYYVESKYLPLYRRPEPGSEYLKKIENPQKYIRSYVK